MIDGLILRGIGGFYYVQTENDIIETKPRGIFRKTGFKPLAGDHCKISMTDDGKGVIEEVSERKNHFVRPPVANLDAIYFVVATTAPIPNYQILDSLIAVAEYKEIDITIVISKWDLQQDAFLKELYESAGFLVFVVDYEDSTTYKEIHDKMQGRINAFSGNSGVGKSTLLNAIDPSLKIETSHTSEKLGRGRHTTRDVRLYPLSDGGYVADTPGFSSMDITRFEDMEASDLADCFREMRPYVRSCRFNDCTHTVEAGCAVLSALEAGEISGSRHSSYLNIYKDLSAKNAWESGK